jgi:signal transduction histidine kinase
MLRARIFLNQVPFLVLPLAVGAFAIIHFTRLASRVDATVSGNYRHILLAEAMRSDLTKMEREAWLDSAGTAPPTPAFKEMQARFETNLTLLTNSVLFAGDENFNAKLASKCEAFKRALSSLAAGDNVKKRQLVYQAEVGPSVLAVDVALQKVRDINNEAILATQESIERIKRDITRPVMIGMGVALLLSIYLFFRMGRSVLEPIKALTLATREVQEGKWNQAVPVFSRDELGELAKSFNAMATQIQEFRRNAGDEIVRLHRTMETTLASFPDPIFVLNQRGCIELKNPAAAGFATALRLENTLPKPLLTIAEQVLATGKNFLPYGFDAVASFRFGAEEKSFLPRVLAMPDRQGTLFVLYDVTRFRLLDAAKSNLVATVSHELKTPLTGVRLALHLLLERNIGPLNAKQDELLQRARDDAERLLRMLNDLLDLARLEEGNAELHREPVAPAELIEAVAHELAGPASRKGLKLAYSAEPDLPSVFADRQRINHVFANLVSNAIKHSPEGGEVVLHAARGEGEGVEFTVSDEGPGIPEEFQVRIFDRFFRVPGQEKTGAGLGLSIAREITVAHGGRIAVKSVPGKGSTFHVVLPVGNGES